MRKTRSHVVAVASLAALLLPVSALAQSGSPAAARVRHFEGSVTVQRAQAGETSGALVNLPLEAGDRLWTAGDGRAEIVLPDGSFLWLDASTTLDVTAVAGLEEDGETILRLWSGSLILRRQRYDDEYGPVPLRIDAPTGSAVLGDEGLYRIDLDDEQRLWLSVLQGRGELVAGGVSEPLSAGERSFAEPGTAPARAVAFNTAEQDSFDRWQQDRLADYAVTERHVAERRYVPRTVVHHVADLEPYGHWNYYDDIGAYGWRPRVSLGWSPYRNGRWVYTHHGWSWVSYSPWGWATSHYGRWHFTAGHGWLWFPGRVYAPAWVNWYVSPGYVGWVPLNYWNRPVVSLNFFFGWGDRYDPHWGRRPYDRGYGRGGAVVAGRGYLSGLDRAWTFVPADRFGARDVGRVAVERTAVPRQSNSVQVRGTLRPRDPGRDLVPSTPSRVAVPRGDGPSGVRTRPGTPAVQGRPGGGSGGAGAVVTPRGATRRPDSVVRPSPGGEGAGRTVVPRRPEASDPRRPDSSRRIVVPRPGGADGRSVDPYGEARRRVLSPPGRDSGDRGAVRRPTVREDYGSRSVLRPPVSRGDSDGRAVPRPTFRGDYGSRSLLRPPVSSGGYGGDGVIRRPTVRGDYGPRSVIRPRSSGSAPERTVIRRRPDSSSLLRRILGRSGAPSVGPGTRAPSRSRVVVPRSSSRPSVRSRGSSSGGRSARPRPQAKPKESGGGS